MSRLDNNKLSNILFNLSKRIKVFFWITAAYFTILILYDLIVFARGIKVIVINYTYLIIIGVIIWFGVRLIFWLQIKNRSCPELMFNMLTLAAMIVFAVSSLIMGVSYFINSFEISAFLAPIALLSLVKVQSLRA